MPTDAAQPQSVLVVDDDRSIREALRDLLDAEGYRVREAADGKEAVRWLREAPGCMVVLLDLNMPVMDGFDVLRAVSKDMRLQRGHAFLVVTAYTHVPIPPDVESVIHDHRIPFVAKPFDVERLLEAVAAAAAQCAISPHSPESPSYPWSDASVEGSS